MYKLSSPEIHDDNIERVVSVLKSGMLVHGAECAQFEEMLKSYTSAPHVAVVSSGTTALHLALVALGIGKGDLVLVPSFTFPASVNVIEHVGATPVFMDVSLDTYNSTAEDVANALTRCTRPPKALMIVHEFGCPADMGPIMQIAKENNFLVIEDAACALGATYMQQQVGLFGDIGCFSFHPRKSITTGEGGMLICKDAGLMETIVALRNHGMVRNAPGEWSFVLPGYNYRLTNIQAALGIGQLACLPTWLQKRRQLKDIYYACLQGCHGLTMPAYIDGHAWQTLMIRLDSSIERSQIVHRLREKEIESGKGAHATHIQPYYKKKYGECNLPHSEVLDSHGLAIPFWQGLSEEDVEYISNVIKQILA